MLHDWLDDREPEPMRRGGFIPAAYAQSVGMRFEEVKSDGERGRTRTCDPCLKRALLYQLSYAPAWIPI